MSSGSTLGHVSAKDQYLYVYAIDNAGTVELAVAGSHVFDEGALQSTTAEGGAGAADSGNVLYSTTSRSNVPIRLIGRIKSNQTVAGTWAASASEVVITTNVPAAQQSYVWVDSGNGHGSSSTKIRRFTNTRSSIGSAITYADSATLGASFTINENGIYSLFYSDSYGAGGAQIAFSINTTAPTTNPSSLSVTELVALSNSPSATTVNSLSITRRLRAGDVIRAHTDGNPNQTGIFCKVEIIKLSD